MHRSTSWALLVIGLCLLGLDIGSKRYVVEHFSSSGICVFRNWCGIDFSLEYVMNKGAAWGFFSSMQLALLWGRCAIILALFAYLFFAKYSFLRNLALVSILSGAVGNVLDFFIYGHVVDMFYFRFWGYSFPVFNIADSAIFCGVVLLFVSQGMSKEKRTSKE